MGRGLSVPSHYLRSSRSLSPPPRSLLYLPVYLSLCFESVFFVHGQSWWSLAEETIYGGMQDWN
ncbi:hypothetical protein Bca4012_029996 [Brassica carinata]